MTDNTGVKSRETGHDAVKAGWLAADQMNREHPQHDGSQWIPVQAVEIDDSVLPRLWVDRKHAEEFSHILGQLPAILVQENTLKLVDGRHRVEGTVIGAQVCVRARFTDVTGDALLDLAYELNMKNGLPITLAEKQKAARAKIARCSTWTNDMIANWAGLSVRAVLDLRADDRAPTYVDKTGTERGLPRQNGESGFTGRGPNQTPQDRQSFANEYMEEPPERMPVMTTFDNAQAAFTSDPGLIILGVGDQYLDALEERFNDIERLCLKWCRDGRDAIQGRRNAVLAGYEEQEYEVVRPN